MPKLRKAILPVGNYLVSTANGGRVQKNFTKEYLTTVSDNANKMVLAGLKIPAPFKHLKEAIPTDQVDTNSFDNGGYWDSFEIADDKGTPTLFGVIDAPGDVDDMRTPAGKLSHTVKEVSACIKDSWTDGLGREWGPCILHSAPVLHPIVPNQAGFTLVEDSVALSVLDVVSEPSMVDISQLSAELAKSGIYIPPDTIVADLPKVMITVLRQKNLALENDKDDHEVVETTSVFMSLPEGIKMKVTKQIAETMVALGAVNPKTQKAFVIEDFEIAVDPMATYALAVTDQLKEQKKAELVTRVNAVVASGRTTKEFADASIFPQIATYELSLGDGAKFQPNNIDLLVQSLEALPPATKPTAQGHKLPHNAEVHVNLSYDEPENDMTADQVQALQKEMLSYMS